MATAKELEVQKKRAEQEAAIAAVLGPGFECTEARLVDQIQAGPVAVVQFVTGLPAAGAAQTTVRVEGIVATRVGLLVKYRPERPGLGKTVLVPWGNVASATPAAVE